MDETHTGKTLAERRLEEVVRLLDHCYSTRTSDSYRGLVVETGENVHVWRLRYPLDLNGEAPLRFLDRLEAIGELLLATPRIRFFGVDPTGAAFLITDFVSGKMLLETMPSINEGKRIFSEAVKAVVQLHDQNILLGDICGQTFIRRDGGEVLIQGLLGPFDRDIRQTALLPSVESLQFLAPEQRSGLGIELASDVYALGALGYRLFTGRFLYGDKPPPLGVEEAEMLSLAPSSIRNELPLWVDDILGKCIEFRPDHRYRSARELYDDLILALGGGQPKVASGRWSSRTLIVQPETLREIRKRGKTVSAEQEAPEQQERRSAEEGKRTVTFLLLFAPALIIGVVLATAIFLFFENTEDQETALEREVHLAEEAAPPELEKSLRDIVAPNIPIVQRKEALNNIAASDDLVAFKLLISVAQSAPVLEIKFAAQEALVERIKKSGLIRSAKLIEEWFSKTRDAKLDPASAPAYESILSACNVLFPLDRRRFNLTQAYRGEPFVATQLAAALSLDEEDRERFAPLLRQFLSAELGRADLEGKSIGALILSHSALAQYFQNDVEKLVATFTNEDLGWLMLELSRSNSPLLQSIAQETTKRNILPPFQGVFLKALMEADRFDLPQQVANSLVRGLRGEISENDILAFGRWISIGSEPVLLAVCAVATDDQVALSAFDTLAAKSLTTPLVDKLIERVKAESWDERTKVVKAMGILGHVDIASDEQIKFALNAFSQVFALNPLIKVIVSTENERTLVLALEQFADKTPTEQLLRLLNHPSKRIRIFAVTGLAGNNQLVILQTILRAYRDEKDGEIKALYNKHHWVTIEGGATGKAESLSTTP